MVPSLEWEGHLLSLWLAWMFCLSWCLKETFLTYLGSCPFLFAFTAEYLEFCFANCLLWGGGASTLWPKFSWLSIMQASELLVPSPFGRSFLRLPPWFQEALRDHGFGPHQSDGHVLMLSCLRVATEDDALVIDDQPTLEVVGDRLTWTDCFAHILNSALTRMGGGDPNAGDPMEVHELMVNLMSTVPRGPDPTAYSDRQLRWEIVDREKWVKSFTPSPITNLQLVKWRHWKPSRIKEVGPINQKVLENHLRRKWAERLLSHLIPHAAVIPHLAPLQGDNETQEFFDLLGDTRFRTLRQRCLVLEQMMKWGLPIPWQETHVRHLLNDLRSQEVTPHKLQLCWDTLRWFSKKFGMMAVHEEHRLLQKKQTVEDSLTCAVTQPSRKAKVPPKEVIWALDEGAAGVPIHPGADSPQGGGGPLPRELDSFILGLVRFQVCCSARLNDLQHTAPFYYAAHHEHPWVRSMADQDSQCDKNQKTSSAVDLPEIQLHGACLVAAPLDVVDKAFISSSLWSHRLLDPNDQQGWYGLHLTAGTGRQNTSVAQGRLVEKRGECGILSWPYLAQLPGLHPRLCLPIGHLERPEEIPGKLDDRVHGRRLHQGEEECGG